MGRFTVDQLRGFAQEPLRKAVRKDARSILRDGAAQDRRTSHDIFLSHNHLDKEAVLGLKTHLEAQGYSVYVDSESDPQLDPQQVNNTTVEVVRSRLRSCRSILYATSENAEESKWMAWELGLGDGLDKKVAVVPVKGTPGSLVTREFLLVYPEIQDGTHGHRLWVRHPKGNFEAFRAWLSSGEAWRVGRRAY